MCARVYTAACWVPAACGDDIKELACSLDLAKACGAQAEREEAALRAGYTRPIYQPNLATLAGGDLESDEAFACDRRLKLTDEQLYSWGDIAEHLTQALNEGACATPVPVHRCTRASR